MCPLSVSPVPAGRTSRFDVVIFDEASQVSPSDAINCIYRGHAAHRRRGPEAAAADGLLHTGPAATGDEWRRRGRSRTSSPSSTSPRQPARSARCRCAGTTAASTSRSSPSPTTVLRRRLVTFPAPTTDGRRRRRRAIQGRRHSTAAAPAGTTRSRPPRSSTGSSLHRHHRPDLQPRRGHVLARRRRPHRSRTPGGPGRHDRPDLDRLFGDDRLDGFFVKNLENVQGDERDIMSSASATGPTRTASSP